MERSREPRRGVTLAASNGLSRRRHRSSSLRDSPDEDGPLELQETARLRDRKKDRDRDRDRDRERDRERDRDRDRERDRMSRSSKRRRSDKFMLGTNRDDGGDDSSEESVNDDEEDDEDEGGGNSSIRMLPPNPSTSSSSMLNHHHHHHHHNHSNNHSNNNHHNSNNNHSSRKSFPPPAKVFRAAPTVTTTMTTTSTWKAADEMIGVSVPRKARSASTKRSHECWTSSGGVVEQIHRQASSSPVRTSVATVLATPAPASPSSSNFSVRRKMKTTGPKLRPPKSSSNKSSSAQDEIEIEIAEVLYGMMRQPQGTSKQEIMGGDSNSRDNNNNKSTSDSKSRVSSPISNSPSTLPQSSSVLPTNSGSSTAPMSAVAPKRKRPRPVKDGDENPSFTVRSIPILSTTKVDAEQSAKIETCLPNFEKNSASAAAENGSVSYDLANSQASGPKLESVKSETNVLLADSKGLTEESESGGDVAVAKDGPQSPKKESTASLRLDDDRRDNLTVAKANSTISEIESQREEKFQIDLMAPPPLRSSPERDSEIDFVAVDVQTETKPVVQEDEKLVKTVKEDTTLEAEEKKAKTIAEESESQKPVLVAKERNIDLQLDLEKNDRDTGSVGLTGNKLQQHVQKQQQPPPPVPEKTPQSNSIPLPLPMASWPGGLPPMGYMAPLQGVVSMDGSTVSSAAIQPPNLLFSQPRPKRCATHCHIARNIHYLQQFTRINPFWPAAAGSASLYGAKACNLNVVPPAELHGNAPGRGVNNVQDKGQGLTVFPGPTGKDNKGSQPSTVVDASQRKQVLLQQPLPPGAPSNILTPAFIFPLSQQQAAAAAAVRPGSVKSPPAAGNAASSNASNSAPVSATATAGAPATAMGFNYPNMPGNENPTQYLAILQNNGYHFPISAHVGAPPAYRGTHAQAVPFFNGPFYSSQMLHPSQIQQQQQQQPPLPPQSHQSQQGHQNTSISSSSSSSQKHLQNQHTRPHNSGVSGGSGTLQGFPAPKSQTPQQLQLQQRHQQQNQQVPHQARQLDNEVGGEESPSTADSRVTRANMSSYGQSYAMALHTPNFGLMTTASMGGASSASGNHTEKKPQQQLQLQGSKSGVDLTHQTFAITAPGLDISSIAQNPAIFQSFPEPVRHSYQMMAAAQSAQQKKNYRVSEEGKTVGGETNAEEERKAVAGKPPATVGQSIAFSRPDLADPSVSTVMGSTVIDSSTRTLNLGSAPARTSVSAMFASMSNVNASAAQQQLQRSQQQQQQMIQLQKQQQFTAAAARNKTQAASNGTVYSDHLSSSSMPAKFANALSVFPQNLVQGNSSPALSPQWKNSGRTTTSQVSSPSLAPSTTSSLKNLPQQQGRTQQSHTQISFAANPKSSAAMQGQQPSGNNQSASPPMVVGSPTTSSISKTSAGGSPRTTATTSTGNKSGQASSLSSQQAKNSPSMPSRKSSPVPSLLGTSNISSSGTGVKPQMPQQQQHQQLPKHAIQPPMLFTNAYMQPQPQHVASTTSATAASVFFPGRHRDQQPQQLPGLLGTSSTGTLSLCPPVTHSNTSTSDPAKAVAASMKGGSLTSQSLLHAAANFGTAQASGKPHPHVATGFYVHPVPTAVQVKPAEQKQPAGE